MQKGNYLTVQTTIKTLNQGNVNCIIYIRNEYAIAKFGHKIVARNIFELEKKQGKDVVWQERINGFIQRFPDKTKEEILEIIKTEMQQSGAKEIKVK